MNPQSPDYQFQVRTPDLSKPRSSGDSPPSVSALQLDVHIIYLCIYYIKNVTTSVNNLFVTISVSIGTIEHLVVISVSFNVCL